jgi:predicted acetyltransferase
MTLREKFIRHTEIPNIFGIWIEDLEAANQCEQIADDYAIEFADWIIDTDNKPVGEFTIRQLLEIFKREKEL